MVLQQDGFKVGNFICCVFHLKFFIQAAQFNNKTFYRAQMSFCLKIGEPQGRELV